MHNKLKGLAIHTPFTWIVANSAARLAINLNDESPSEQVFFNDRVCLQLDDNTVWRLVDYSSMTWASINNSIQLGSDSNAPRIKFKKLIGTTSPDGGGNVSVAHGLVGGKILDVVVKVEPSVNNGIFLNYISTSGYQYGFKHDSTNVIIENHITNSENILSKPFIVLITYEE